MVKRKWDVTVLGELCSPVKISNNLSLERWILVCKKYGSKFWSHYFCGNAFDDWEGVGTADDDAKDAEVWICKGT